MGDIQSMQAEIERLRKQVAEKEAAAETLKQAKAEKPSPLPNPDWLPLIKLIEEYVAFVASDEYHEDNDYSHYIEETAIECLYGGGVWEWFKKVL